MLKQCLLLLFCVFFLVPDKIATAAPLSDELKMLIDISNSISSVTSELESVEKKFIEIKTDFSTLNRSIEDLTKKIIVVEQWKNSVEAKFIEMKSVNDKVNELDRLNSTGDAKTSIYISIAGFLASAVITVLIGQFFTKKKK